MGHRAIIGMTGSGKTTLARSLAAEYRRRCVAVLVLDPFASPDWPANWMTSELAPFLAKAKRSTRCALFIEEAGDYGRDPSFAWLFTQSRHWGHVVHYVSQYHSQVLPIVRTNCQELILFRVSGRSADVWGDDFSQPEIPKLAAGLKQYQFIMADRYNPPKVRTLSFPGSPRLKPTPEAKGRLL